MDDILVELPDYITKSPDFLIEELVSALRNRELPLEALRYDISPPGLHYLLSHFDIPMVDPDTWHLLVHGAVGRPLELDLSDLRALGMHSVTVTLECAGNGRGWLSPRPIGQPWLSGAVSTATWTGTRLASVLEAAGVSRDAVEVVFTGADRGREGSRELAYERSLALGEAQGEDVLLAWSMNDEPLPVQHGAPLRLIVPDWYGMASVKWLQEIRVVREPFEGSFQTDAYRIFMPGLDHAPPVTRMAPRALLTPPGAPDAETGDRILNAGPVMLMGRAWSGLGPIAEVCVRIGDGEWEPAELDPAMGDHAWRGFRFEWHARPGTWEVFVRALDVAGNEQPVDAPWNLHGYANNALRPVTVSVRS